MLNCSKTGRRITAVCGLWLSIGVLSAITGTATQAVATQQSASDSAAIPEQIRQLLARAVTAMDRADAAASLQLVREAAALWQQAGDSQPDVATFKAVETATADLAVPLLERLLGRWRAGAVAAESIAEVLQPMVISSDGSRVSLLQSSLKGPGYPFILENCGASIAARAAVTADVHRQWIKLLRQGSPQPTIEQMILLWLLNHEADQPIEQAEILQQLLAVVDLSSSLPQHGLQLTHMAMCGLQSRNDQLTLHSLKLVHKLAEDTSRSGAPGVQLRLLRDACIAAAPEAHRLDSAAGMLESLRLADFLIEQFAARDDSSPATRLLTQHYLITSQLCLVHQLPTDGLRRFALFRTLQTDTSSLTAADLQYFLPLQSVHSLTADNRWQLFRMVLESELWLLTRDMQPQVTTDVFPASRGTGLVRYELLQEIARAAIDCGEHPWLQELWQKWSAQGDPAARRGLQMLAQMLEQPTKDAAVSGIGGWLTDETPEQAALGPVFVSTGDVPGGVLAAELSRPAVWHFPWPLTGKFRIRSQFAVSDFPVTLPGYAGLMLALDQQGTTTVLSCSAAVVQRRQSGWRPPASDSPIVGDLQVADQQLRYIVSDSDLWSLNAAEEASPWLFLQLDMLRQSDWAHFSIEGTPQVPRSVSLLKSTDLRGWSSRSSGQSQPDLRIDPASHSGQPPVGSPDWYLQSGVLTGRRSLQRAAPLPGFPQVVEPFGHIVCQRPMFPGDRISWEFEYQPGQCHAFPSIGSAILELHADGIFLNSRDPAWWRQLQGFGGQRSLLTPQQHPVPLKNGWNQAQLRRTSSGFQLELNGQQQCDLPWNPNDARFGLTYRRATAELRVRNVVLQGDWPEQFLQADFQRILRNAGPGTAKD